MNMWFCQKHCEHVYGIFNRYFITRALDKCLNDKTLNKQCINTYILPIVDTKMNVEKNNLLSNPHTHYKAYR